MSWQDGRSLANAISYLGFSKTLLDVSFKFPCDGVSNIKAHKLILSARSSVFETMFYGSLPEGKVVRITDIEPGIFELMLRFIYTDDTTGINDDTAIALIHAAHKYQIMTLIDKCKDYLKENMSNDTVCLIFSQAVLLQIQDLKDAALDFLENNAACVFRSEGWKNLSLCGLSLILDSDSFLVCELAIFNAALTWAENKCRRQGLPCSQSNMRRVLGDIFFKIRFPRMTLEEFRQYVVTKAVLSEREELTLFRILTAPLGSNTEDSPFVKKPRSLKFSLNIEAPNDPNWQPMSFKAAMHCVRLQIKCTKRMELLGLVLKIPQTRSPLIQQPPRDNARSHSSLTQSVQSIKKHFDDSIIVKILQSGVTTTYSSTDRERLIPFPRTLLPQTNYDINVSFESENCSFCEVINEKLCPFCKGNIIGVVSATFLAMQQGRANISALDAPSNSEHKGLTTQRASNPSMVTLTFLTLE